MLRELFRVVAPLGRLLLLTCIYKELPNWPSSVRGLSVPVHVRSANEYKCILQAAGWDDVHTEELLKKSEPSDNGTRPRPSAVNEQRDILADHAQIKPVCPVKRELN